MSPPHWTPARGWVSDDEDDFVDPDEVVPPRTAPEVVAEAADDDAEPVAEAAAEEVDAASVAEAAAEEVDAEPVAEPAISGRAQPEVWEVAEVTGHPRVDEALAGVNAFADAAPAEQIGPLTEAHASLRSTLDSIGDV